MKPFDFNWDEHNISNYWDMIYSQMPNDEYQGTSFAELAANDLIKFIIRYIKLEGDIFEYGSGNGYFMDQLLRKHNNIKLYGSEFSEKAVKMINEKLNKNRNFGHCYLIRDNNIVFDKDYKFDSIVMFEVVEHMLDDQLKEIFSLFNSLLKPNGKLVITTPNEEDLNMKKTLCPNCGARYHPIQHVQSFNKNRLVKLLQDYNFNVIECRSKYLSSNNSIKQKLKKLYYAFNNDKAPNLIYIGQKIS